MEVLFLTVFLSLCLAGYFMVLFYKSYYHNPDSCTDRESILPFEEEKSVTVKPQRVNIEEVKQSRRSTSKL